MKHLVDIGGNNKLSNVTKRMFAPGETVSFNVFPPSDLNLSVTSEQVKIHHEGSAPDGSLVYRFEMPDCDVTVRIKTWGGMEMICSGPDERPPATVPPFGIGVTRPAPEFHPDATPVSKPLTERIFCPECGAELEKGQKFCNECGYDVRPVTE